MGWCGQMCTSSFTHTAKEQNRSVSWSWQWKLERGWRLASSLCMMLDVGGNWLELLAVLIHGLVEFVLEQSDSSQSNSGVFSWHSNTAVLWYPSPPSYLSVTADRGQMTLLKWFVKCLYWCAVRIQCSVCVPLVTGCWNFRNASHESVWSSNLLYNV